MHIVSLVLLFGRRLFPSRLLVGCLSLVLAFAAAAVSLAATPAELTKDLLQQKKEIPGGDRWTVELIDPHFSNVGTVQGAVGYLLYPACGSKNTSLQRKMPDYATDTRKLTALLQSATPSDQVAQVLYEEEYLKTPDVRLPPSTDYRRAAVQMAIWEFPSEEAVARFGQLLRKIADEALVHQNQLTRQYRAQQVENLAAENKRKMGKSYYWTGGAKIFSEATIGSFGADYDMTSLGLGAGDVLLRQQLAETYYERKGSEWIFQGATHTGATHYVRCHQSAFIPKGNRVLVVWANCGDYGGHIRQTVYDRVDGKLQRVESILIDGVPMPLAAMRGIFRSAYYKMAHESPADDANFVTIRVVVPETKYLRKRIHTVFGPAFPDFREAEVHGLVQWETLFDHGHVYNATAYLEVIHQGKVVKRRRLAVDDGGAYNCTIKINKKGSLPSQKFLADISCRLIDTSKSPTPPVRYTTVQTTPESQALPNHVQAKLKRYLDHCPPAQRKVFDRLAYGVACLNDLKHKAAFGSGTPNLDKYYQNRKTPSGEITNALVVLGEVYVSKDPALSAAKNADDRLKQVQDYLKSKGITVFKNTGNGQSDLNISQWLKNVGDADYLINSSYIK